MSSNLTRILGAIEQGDGQAADRLFPLVYDELRQMARRKMHRENPGHTLQTTALVHEVYLKMFDGDATPQWNGRRHFFAAAGEAMRRILVDQARRKKNQKNGGQLVRCECDLEQLADPPTEQDLSALSEALDKLAQVDPQTAELIKLRYFIGMSLPEAAEILALSERTARNHWNYAKAWLVAELLEVED